MITITWNLYKERKSFAYKNMHSYRYYRDSDGNYWRMFKNEWQEQ